MNKLLLATLVLILTGYPYDQQVVYGSWKAMQQEFCC